MSRRTPLEVCGSYLEIPEVHRDERGFMCCTSEALEGERPVRRYLTARSAARVIRGLHFLPAGESKLVRCVAGSVFDVVVDLRADSPSYLSWQSVELDGDSQCSVYVPAGCAHGYQALEDGTVISYHIDRDFAPGADQVLAFDDPELGILWPLEPGAMSDRDLEGMPLRMAASLVKWQITA